MIQVEVRYTKGVSRADNSAELIAGLRRPMVLAERLAVRISERVQRSGDLATQVERYKEDRAVERKSARASKDYYRYEAQLRSAIGSGDHKRIGHLKNKLQHIDNQIQKHGEALERGYRINEDYARLLGITQTKFRSSYAFHTAVGTRPGTFRVSGGMWSGLGVVNQGANAAVLAFFGSTRGGALAAGVTKGGRARARPPLVRNQTKAATVFRQSGVNVIQPKESEETALGSAVCRWSQHLIARTLGATIGGFQGDGDQQLLRDILQHYDGSR